MRILKFTLEITDRQAIPLDADAKILSVHNQRGAICLWALCPYPPVNGQRFIRIYGTGDPLPSVTGTFLGTVHEEPFVWHIFEEQDQQ